ncbi:putative Tic20 family protein [Dysgonomonadaceae bacterium PH5-43]|nr:putative Tic20 family protein [Dysgonomonadaceae bacterium PH5-43]
MSYNDLKDLDELRKQGAITEEEYQREKEKVFNSANSATTKPLFGLEENTYLMLMHLSQFAGFLIPLLGFIAPVVLWLMNKDNNANVDLHGKNILNFMISWLIYGAIAVVLMIILIGGAILAVLAVLDIVFIILAAIKAMNGEYWKYPLTITVLK